MAQQAAELSERIQQGRPVDTFQNSVMFTLPTHGPDVGLQNIERTLNQLVKQIKSYLAE